VVNEEEDEGAREAILVGNANGVAAEVVREAISARRAEELLIRVAGIPVVRVGRANGPVRKPPRIEKVPSEGPIVIEAIVFDAVSMQLTVPRAVR
jgi:hypothetical protein